jgi:hypothetical protein
MKADPERPGAPIPPPLVAETNERFRAQRDAYDLRYRCEDCGHYDPEEDRCSLKFESELFGEGPHRCRTDAGDLLFCKYFEVD